MKCNYRVAILGRSAENRRRASFARPAYTIFELVVALGVFAVLLLVVGQTVGMVARQRREAERRELAARSVENLMERAFALPWNELTEENLTNLSLPEEARRLLPGAALQISAIEEEGPPPGKRIVVKLFWNDVAGPVSRPALLVAWRHEP